VTSEDASTERTPLLPSDNRTDGTFGRRVSVGRYQVRWILGRGGEAAVYEALDPDLARRVALKVYEGVDSRLAARLVRAARLAGQLVHPNIVLTLDFVRAGNTWAFVQELLEGHDLDTADLASARVRLNVLHSIASAMMYAHNRGIAHLDLKFSNVFYCTDGTVKVLDFGLARDFSVHATVPVVGGGLIGTPLYIAPEIYRHGTASLLSDVWSFAVLAFRLVADAYPFNAVTAYDLAHAICDGPLPRLDGVRSGDLWREGVGESDFASLVALIDAALQRAPDDRPTFTMIHNEIDRIVRRQR
jgi:eukaryotic-like serine/threonine-protein kinase